MNFSKQAICDLFEVHIENGVARVVTPLEYSGTGDNIVVRVRPKGAEFSIDENGEAAFHAAMAGGDMASEVVARWIEEVHADGLVKFDADSETLSAVAETELAIAPAIFRVADAAQRLNAIAVSRTERRDSDFKETVRSLISEVATALGLEFDSDVELPIAGELRADHIIQGATPLLIIAASHPARLLEAEVIYMQYRAEKRKAHVWAIAETQAVVGKKHFERAGYYTDRAVVFQREALRQLVTAEFNAPAPRKRATAKRPTN